MNKREKQAAFEAVGRSRSCAECEAQDRTQFCRVCFKESMKSFGMGIRYERRRAKESICARIEALTANGLNGSAEALIRAGQVQALQELLNK